MTTAARIARGRRPRRPAGHGQSHHPRDDRHVTLDLDGSGLADVVTGVGFYDHLLVRLAHHGLLDLTIRATGDLDVDDHHTVEDVALVLGAALAEALGDRTGISRFGDATVPMDEAVASADPRRRRSAVRRHRPGVPGRARGGPDTPARRACARGVQPGRPESRSTSGARAATITIWPKRPSRPSGVPCARRWRRIRAGRGSPRRRARRDRGCRAPGHAAGPRRVCPAPSLRGRRLRRRQSRQH